MACFLVPGTEAIVTTIVTAVVKKKENNELKKVSADGVSAADKIGTKFSTKLGWLNKMLWGGSALLAFEHISLRLLRMGKPWECLKKWALQELPWLCL